MPWQLFIAIACIAINAYFVAIEFALTASRVDKLEILAIRHPRRASTVIATKKRLAMTLSGTQLGITVCSILLGTCCEPYIHDLVAAALHSFHASAHVVTALSFFLAIMCVVMCHMLFGEMIPKNIALMNPEQTAMLLTPGLIAFMTLTRPITLFYLHITQVILRFLKTSPGQEKEIAMTSTQMANLIGQSHEAGFLDKSEYARMNQILNLQALTVNDVATPLSEMTKITAQSFHQGVGVFNATDIENIALPGNISRFLVTNTSGELLGYIHIKDIIPYLMNIDDNDHEHHSFQLAVLPLAPIQADFPLYQTVTALRKNKNHVAQVIRIDKSNNTKDVVGIAQLDVIVKLFIDAIY